MPLNLYQTVNILGSKATPVPELGLNGLVQLAGSRADEESRLLQYCRIRSRLLDPLILEAVHPHGEHSSLIV